MEDKQEQKFQQMTQQPVGGLICRLAVPCIISMLVTAFYNMADTFFVGLLQSDAATGAVGVVYPMMAIIQAIGFLFGQGSGNYISRCLGQKNREEAEIMASTGFFSALFAGLVIGGLGLIFLEPLSYLLGSTETILPYAKDYLRIILLGAPWMTASLVLNNQLRFQGSAIYSMLGIASGAVLNIGLDPLLIFVFDMGESVKIADLARRMIKLAGLVEDKDIKIEYSGLRPGEKLYEEVLSNAENTIPTDHKRIHIAKVRAYNYEEACVAVDKLERFAQEVEIPEMVKYMKQVVPEFISKNSIFEKYDNK